MKVFSWTQFMPKARGLHTWQVICDIHGKSENQLPTIGFGYLLLEGFTFKSFMDFRGAGPSNMRKYIWYKGLIAQI